MEYRLVQGDRERSSNVFFFVPPKYLALEPPDLRVETRKVEDRRVVEVTATRFAAFVHVGVRDGYALFSDNDFHLLPGETHRVEVVSSEVPDDRIGARLFARSLIDTRRGATATEGRPDRP